MPICKNCHRTIQKFDKDICPYCGTENPIEDNYVTKDVTGFIKSSHSNEELYKSKSRKTAGFLCLLLGYFGIHNFYLGYIKKGVLELILSLAIIGGVGSALFFLLEPLKNALAFLIPFALVFVFYLLASIHYFKDDSLMDVNGELLK